MPTLFEFPPWLIVGFTAVFGLIIGSFLNVVIHRVPRRQSVVTPRSRCPECGHEITWYENVPLVSYVALGGRCRSCKTPISARYFVVELLTGVVFTVLVLFFGFGLLFIKYSIFAAMLIALMFIDLNDRLLPDAITFPGMAVGFTFSLFVPVGDGTIPFIAHLFRWGVSFRLVSFGDALLGAIVGGGLLWMISEVYFRLRHREGLGFGDVKLMGMVGAFLGVKLALLTIFLGSLAGSLIGGLYMTLQRKGSRYELPFGTFLGMMALVAALWGKEMVQWYLSRAF